MERVITQGDRKKRFVCWSLRCELYAAPFKKSLCGVRLTGYFAPTAERHLLKTVNGSYKVYYYTSYMRLHLSTASLVNFLKSEKYGLEFLTVKFLSVVAYCLYMSCSTSLLNIKRVPNRTVRYMPTRLAQWHGVNRASSDVLSSSEQGDSFLSVFSTISCCVFLLLQ